MPKLNISQKIKTKLAAAKTKIHQSNATFKARINKINQDIKTSTANTKAKIKNIKPPKVPKINFKINLNLKKKEPEAEPTPIAKTLQKGIKIVDKYPLYEPFAQVVIV